MAVTTITRDVTRTNPTAPALDTLQSTANLKLFTAVLSNADNALALTAARAQNVTDAIGALMVQVDSTGLRIYMIVDGHHNDADSIAQRIGLTLDTAAASATLASGVYTCGGGGTVTVAEETDFEDLQN